MKVVQGVITIEIQGENVYHKLWKGGETLTVEQLEDTDRVWTGSHYVSGKKFKETLEKALKPIDPR